MTEIIVLADKSISSRKSEKSYYGESQADIFKLLIPCRLNGIYTENSDISFCFARPDGSSYSISLNEYGFVATRLRSYFIFYFRPNKNFYSNVGNVKCWVEIKYNDVLIKSDICEIKVHKHFYSKMQEKIIT